MAANSLLKDILDSLEDPDTIQLFAAANGLVGDVEVENRLQELEWERHIDKLWQEVVQQLDAPAKRPRMTLDADDQPSTSGQFGGGNELLKNRTLYGRRTRGLIKRTWPLIQVSRSNSTTNGEEKN